MILVSGLYAVTWAPMYTYTLLRNFHSEFTAGANDGLLAALSIAYLYMCANPFIYATKFDPVKRVLLALIPCKRNTPAPAAGADNN